MTRLQLMIASALFTICSSAGASDSGRNQVCQDRVEKLIKTTAANMGLKTQFGLQLTRRPANGPVVEFVSGAFVVPDGYISEASALVTVKMTAKSCQILKMSISIGAVK